MGSEESSAERSARRWPGIILALVLVLLATIVLSSPWGRELCNAWSVESIKARLLDMGPWAWALSAGLMILQAIAFPLPAFVITVANGYVFGPFWGAFSPFSRRPSPRRFATRSPMPSGAPSWSAGSAA